MEALFENVEEVLLDLGDDVVSELSSAKSKSSVFSAATAATSHSSSIEVYGGVHEKHQLHNTLPSRDSPMRQVLQPGTQPVSHTPRIATCAVVPSSPTASHPDDAPKPQSSSSSPRGSIIPEVCEQSVSQLPIKLLPTKQWSEGDYINVQSSLKKLKFEEGANPEIHDGYMNANRERTSALVVESFSENVISELRAKMLGLNIQWFHLDEDGPADGDHALDKLEDMSIEFENGDLQTVIGRVAFEWRTTEWRPLKVFCLVCEYVPVPTSLIFGQPYVKKKKHYASE
jgi:hypothetical protein